MKRRQRRHWLAADALAIIIPGVTGAGVAVRTAAHTGDAVKAVDKIVKAEKAAEKAAKIAKAEERVAKLSKVSREGQDMTKAGKEAVHDLNAARNDGKVICEHCKVETIPATQSKKGVSPSPKERRVDHVDAKSKGGSGTPDNGQSLCITCNAKKSNN